MSEGNRRSLRNSTPKTLAATPMSEIPEAKHPASPPRRLQRHEPQTVHLNPQTIPKPRTDNVAPCNLELQDPGLHPLRPKPTLGGLCAIASTMVSKEASQSATTPMKACKFLLLCLQLYTHVPLTIPNRSIAKSFLEEPKTLNLEP